MKKIFSLILVGCMLLSSLTAFAEGEAKVFEALTKSVYSGEFEVSVNAKLNKPLLIADIIENIMFANGEADPVNLKLLLENLINSEIKADGNKISVSSDNSYVFRTLKIYENSLAVEKDGVEILIDNPVFKDGDCYWVGTDFTEKVLNSKLTDMSMSDYMTTYSFERE